MKKSKLILAMCTIMLCVIPAKTAFASDVANLTANEMQSATTTTFIFICLTQTDNAYATIKMKRMHEQQPSGNVVLPPEPTTSKKMFPIGLVLHRPKPITSHFPQAIITRKRSMTLRRKRLQSRQTRHTLES